MRMPMWWRAFWHKPIDYRYGPGEAFHDCPLGCQLCAYNAVREGKKFTRKANRLLNKIIKEDAKNFPKARMLKP